MRVKFAEVGGIPTRYYYEGSGAPLMLVHGAGVSGDSWLRNIDELARDFSIVALDTMGHGFTGTGAYTGGPPHAYMVDHLIALANHVGFDKFSLAGSSFGAMLSILTHFKIKDRVEKLILISSGSSTLSEEEHLKSVQNAYKNGMSAMENPTYENCRARLGRIFFDPSKIPEELLWMQVTLYARPGVKDNYEKRMKGMMDPAAKKFRVAERMHEITVPTLLVWGLNDPRVIYGRAVEAANQIKQSTLVGFPECGHEPHIEHWQRFNTVARKFLKDEQIKDDRQFGQGAEFGAIAAE
ncbi:MAG: alpha/beta hydrolase [Alphaproteobacteria bacterium]|nr:alpha/beta hydrolase [Alphaproteobacteria bacterium]